MLPEGKIPLVSAIMPTSRRREMARAAVRMFHEQNWPFKELIVLDDSLTPSFDEYSLGMNAGAVFYERAGPRMTIGEKRNICIASAAAEIIIHWDSDDIYSPDRMLDQMVRLMEHPEAEMTGYHQMQFVDEELEKRYLYDSGPGHAIGTSMCYWKRVWDERKFRHMDESEDTDFAGGRKIFSVPAERRLVSRIHTGNSVDKRLLITRNPHQWKPVPWDAMVAA